MNDFGENDTNEATDDFIDYQTDFKQGRVPPVMIVDAYKGSSPDGGSGGHVTYGVKFKVWGTNQDLIIRRRYSDFESMRKYLETEYPQLIIPPIPEKHKISNYATTKRAKEEQSILEKRQRMLQSFLNRLLAHPTLSKDQLVHRFLEADIPWSDIIGSEGPKKEKLQFSSSRPKSIDSKFAEYESNNTKSGEALAEIDKINKKLGKKYNKLSDDLIDFGAAFNGLSLEDPHLTQALEKFGQSIDSSQIATENISKYFTGLFGDSLHEIVLYSSSIKTTLKYRTQKQLILEDITDQIFCLKNGLLQLESKRSKSGLNWMKTSLSNLTDADPEQTRSNSIVKTKDLIQQLEEVKEQTALEIAHISVQIQKEIKRFQSMKLEEWKQMLRNLVKEIVKYHEENVINWQNTVNDPCFVQK